MEENKLNKSNKIKVIVLTALLFLIAISGITYAYFSIQIVGNEEASSIRVTTANLKLIYTDTLVMSGDKIYPGWSETKTITVENAGNQTVEYGIIWRELLNEITNNELVITATCTSNVEDNTCEGISEIVIPTNLTLSNNIVVKYGISIEVGETHTYTVTVTFKETGSVQNYNQNKQFYGTLNIADGDSLATPAQYFTYESNYDSVTYDIDLETCISYTNSIGMRNPEGFCNNTWALRTVEGDLLSNRIQPSEYVTYGLSNVIFNSSITITGYDVSGGSCLVIPTTINGDSVVAIDQSAFFEKGLTSAVIPSSVTKIGNFAFFGNQLTSVIIQGKSSSSDFTTYGSNIWGWASGYDDSDIIWTGNNS